MVASSPLELRRRTAVERRALELLRGAPGISGGLERALQSAGDEHRKRLRELALVVMQHGFAIQPQRATYVHLNELRLLHLIADAQTGKVEGGMTEPLKAAVMEIAVTLACLGIEMA